MMKYRYIDPNNGERRNLLIGTMYEALDSNLRLLKSLFNLPAYNFNADLARSCLNKIRSLPELDGSLTKFNYDLLFQEAKASGDSDNLFRALNIISHGENDFFIQKDDFLMELALESECKSLWSNPIVHQLHLQKEERFLIVTEDILSLRITKYKTFVSGYWRFMPFVIETSVFIDLVLEWIHYLDSLNGDFGDQEILAPSREIDGMNLYL